MSNKIMTFSATALTALTLTGVIPTAAFANTFDQNKAATQVEGVTIPDANLRNELTKALGKAEGAPLSREELATIKKLNLTRRGINSLEGLEYCRNLEKLDILNQEKGVPNTFNGSTSLKNLKHLDSINLHLKDTTDFSHFENTVIKEYSHNINVFASANVDAAATEDGRIILKNPCVGFNGEVLVPEDLQGATYDKELNVFTWTKENFDKFALQNSIHEGRVHLKFNVASIKLLFGGHLNINIDLYVGRPNIIPEKEGVTIPDTNLRNELTKVLGKTEGTQLLAEELATITELNLSNKGIASLEGLQYCTNLEKLNIGNFTKDTWNTFTDLTPLKNLKKLETLDLHRTEVTDFSPLKNLPLDWKTTMFETIPSVTAESNENGTFSIKNPYVGINGEVLNPTGLKGATYDKITNTFTWTQEAFAKYAINDVYVDAIGDHLNRAESYDLNKQHLGEVPLNFSGEENGFTCYGANLYVKCPKGSEVKASEAVKVKSSFTFYGNKDSFGNNKNFVKLNYSDDHTITLIEGLHSYCTLVNSSFKDTYASILAKDKDGNVLFNKTYKGTDNISPKEEIYNLPEGATLDLYHAEGTTERFTTNDNQNLKQDPGTTYHYVVKNGQLVQVVSKLSEIIIGGQGAKGFSDHSHDDGFARITLDVKNHKASLIKNSDYRFHWQAWQSSKYASIKLTDPKGNVLYDQSWKGNESVKGNGYRKFGTFSQYDLPEGSTVEIYHAEGIGKRFRTNNDAELKNKFGKAGHTYTYKMQNNKLVLQSVK